MSFPSPGDEFVGRYVIDRIIGRGGFSRVYKATQKGVDRPVAIKVLDPDIRGQLSNEERDHKLQMVIKRFEREAKLVSRLKDPNTVMMYDYGRTETGLLYIVLEYIDGVTITDLVRGTGCLPAERVAKILKQTLTSLQEAHAFGVLHRDIKPQNIMVYEHIGRKDQVKVLDFGIAKAVSESAQKASTSELTADGMLIGTPRYMSPEQIRGDSELGPASDIYSLGLVAYEMLTGVKAVAADSSMKIIAKHLDPRPIVIPEGVNAPGSLTGIINHMLHKDFRFRYQSCDEVLEALEHWKSDRPNRDTIRDLSGAPTIKHGSIEPSARPAAQMPEAPPTVPLSVADPSDISIVFEHPANRRLAAGISSVALVIIGLLGYTQCDSDVAKDVAVSAPQEPSQTAVAAPQEPMPATNNIATEDDPAELMTGDMQDMGQDVSSDAEQKSEPLSGLKKTTQPKIKKKRKMQPKKTVATPQEKTKIDTKANKKGLFIRPLDRR